MKRRPDLGFLNLTSWIQDKLEKSNKIQTNQASFLCSRLVEDDLNFNLPKLGFLNLGPGIWAHQSSGGLDSSVVLLSIWKSWAGNKNEFKLIQAWEGSGHTSNPIS